MSLLISLLIFLPKILLGFALAHLLWKDSSISAVLLKLATGVPLGLAISASAFFIAVWAGLAPRIYSWIELFGVTLIASVFLVTQFSRQRKDVKFSGLSWQVILGVLILTAGAALSIGAFLYYSRLHPFGFEDAWSIWNFPARVIFRENSADILLNSQSYTRFHPDYPVELSLNVAWGWLILGIENSRVPIAISLLTLLTPAVLMAATLNKWKGGLAGALAALIVLVTPDFTSAVGQYADPLLALHMLAAAALFYGYLKSREEGLLLLASLLAGFSAWVKNEGILFIGVFSIVFLLAAWKRIIPWKAAKQLAIGLLIPILVVVLFKLVVEAQNDVLAGRTSLLSQILDLSRWSLIARSFLEHISGYANWPVSLVLILLIYALLMGYDSRETPYQILLLLLILGQLAGYFLIYLITPHQLELHINTSMQRLVFHLFPIFILWLFAAFRSPSLHPMEQAPG